jgi:hypothetical protein
MVRASSPRFRLQRSGSRIAIPIPFAVPRRGAENQIFWGGMGVALRENVGLRRTSIDSFGPYVVATSLRIPKGCQWLAGQALNDKLEARFGVPLDRLRRIEALFAPRAGR